MTSKANSPALHKARLSWSRRPPQHWKVKRLKYVATVNPSKTEIAHLPNDYEVSFFPMELIGEGNLSTTIARSLGEVNQGFTYFRDGDVLIAKITPSFENGKGAIAERLTNGIGFGTTELHVLRPSPSIDPHFLYYITVSRDFREVGAGLMQGTAGQKRVPDSFIANYLVALPPLPQQCAIVDYLDREIARIDSLTAAKEHLLELLAEKRRAIITRAVTRGLNVDALVKNSGVEWLGAVPRHWEVTKIKYVAQVGNGATPFRDNLDYWRNGLFPWLTSTVVNSEIVGEPTDLVTEIALKECHLPIVPPNSVLVAITGEGKTRGKAAILKYQATINQHLAFISPDVETIIPEYIQAFLSSSYEILRMISDGSGSTKGALTCQQLGEFSVPLPPLDEQRNIVKHLAEWKHKIDDLSQKTQYTLDLLHERRAVLIAAAVSGQIEIPSAS